MRLLAGALLFGRREASSIWLTSVLRSWNIIRHSSSSSRRRAPFQSGTVTEKQMIELVARLGAAPSLSRPPPAPSSIGRASALRNVLGQSGTETLETILHQFRRDSFEDLRLEERRQPAKNRSEARPDGGGRAL